MLQGWRSDCRAADRRENTATAGLAGFVWPNFNKLLGPGRSSGTQQWVRRRRALGARVIHGVGLDPPSPGPGPGPSPVSIVNAIGWVLTHQASNTTETSPPVATVERESHRVGLDPPKSGIRALRW